MEAIQQVLTVLCVLGFLGGTLYWLRTKGIARFAAPGLGRGKRRMQSIERLSLTQQHSLHLVSVAGRELLIAVSPGGCSILDGSTAQATNDFQMVTK